MKNILRFRKVSKWIFLVSVLTSHMAYATGCDAPVAKDFPQVPITESKLSPAALVRLNQEIDGAGFDVRGLLILHNCRLVFERYKKGVERDDTHALYSVTKSITSTLIGRLLLEGKIASVGAPLGTLIHRPFLVADSDWEKLQAIQLEHVMRLRSGFQWAHDVKVGNPVHGRQADMLRDGIRLPLVEKPGAKFNYSDYDGALVGFAVSDVMGKSLPDAAQTLLYDPLQIPKPGWDFQDRVGRYSGAFGARLRPMDMLKIGQLYLQKGRWNGVQLLSPEFVNTAMPVDPAYTGSYGLMWWIAKNPDLDNVRFFFANGRKAQRIYVFPQWDMVVAIVSTLTAEDEQQMLRPLLRGLKAMAEGGPGDAEAVKKLTQISTAGFNGSRSFAETIDIPRKGPDR